MPQWTMEHRVFAYDSFIKIGELIPETQRFFRCRLNIGCHGNIPSRNTILRWVTSFRARGTIMKKKPPGPVATARTPQNVERVREAVVRSPTHFAQRHAVEFGISQSSVRQILHKDLGFHPYKMMIVQTLNKGDYQQRSAFAQLMLEIIEEHKDMIIMMSDEAHFHLNGSVNKQNFQYWAPQNSHEVHERPLHSPKVTVWCVIGKVGIIGPYFFEENGITMTVNSARYIDMINNFLEPELRSQRINNQNVWFQQDGATTHTARAAMAVVRAMFPDCLIS